MVKDYSSRPLTRKLGIGENSALALLHAPRDFILDIYANVTVRRTARGHVDVVLAFFCNVSNIEQEMERLGQMVFPNGSLWIAWPKRASHVPTDVADHLIRDIALPLGLVDNKICSVDETWRRCDWCGD